MTLGIVLGALLLGWSLNKGLNKCPHKDKIIKFFIYGFCICVPLSLILLALI